MNHTEKAREITECFMHSSFGKLAAEIAQALAEVEADTLARAASYCEGAEFNPMQNQPRYAFRNWESLVRAEIKGEAK